MKIYLAGRFNRLEELRGYADCLTSDGHEVTASWVYGGEEGLKYDDIAELDFKDVQRADCIVHFTEPHASSNPGGGAHTEFGIAIALGLELFIVGEKQQVFHWTPGVTQFPHFKALRHYLRGRRDDIRGIPNEISDLETPIGTTGPFYIPATGFGWGNRGGL